MALCLTLSLLSSAHAEIPAERPPRQSPGIERAVAWGEIVSGLCTEGRVGSLGLPPHYVTMMEAEGASHPIDEAQLDQLGKLVKSYRVAQAYNHHGSGLAQMRGVAVEIDKATRAIFGGAHLFATFSAECKVSLSRKSSWDSDWNDDPAARSISEKPLDLARSILAIRSAQLGPHDSLVLEARFLLAELAPPNEAEAQRESLARDLDVTPEQALSGVRDPAPIMALLTQMLRRDDGGDDHRLEYLTRYYALDRAKAISNGARPSGWRLNATAVNEHVPSSTAEVRDTELTVAAMEAAYGKNDAELAFPLYELGERYRSAGRRDDARAVLVRALSLANGNSVLPQRSWQGEEAALKAYIAAELAMADQQDGRFDDADHHFSACLRFVKTKTDPWQTTSSCLLNFTIFIDGEVEARQYDAVDRDMHRVLTMLNRELGPDANEWLDFGLLWADSYKARGDRVNEAMQLRELIRRRPDMASFRERLAAIRADHAGAPIGQNNAEQ